MQCKKRTIAAAAADEDQHVVRTWHGLPETADLDNCKTEGIA